MPKNSSSASIKQNPRKRFDRSNMWDKIKAELQTFVGDGYEWYVTVYPKGDTLSDHDHMSLYLNVPNPLSLPNGWNRRARYYFSVLNNSDKELYRSLIGQDSYVFCAENPGWGYRNAMPLSRLEEIGVLEKDRLIIEVYINIVEGDSVDETVDIKGFQVFASQAGPVTKIFAEHPEFAKDLKLKNQVGKTEYMNVVLKLITTLQKPPISLSETELSEACSNLNELMDVGFKVEWLMKKIEEAYLERKKSTDADGSLVQQLMKRVKRES